MGKTYIRNYWLIAERDGERCNWCGSLDSLEVDHIIPRVKGGSNDLSNLQLLCQVCNRSKGAHATPGAWILDPLRSWIVHIRIDRRYAFREWDLHYRNGNKVDAFHALVERDKDWRSRNHRPPLLEAKLITDTGILISHYRNGEYVVDNLCIQYSGTVRIN